MPAARALRPAPRSTEATASPTSSSTRPKRRSTCGCSKSLRRVTIVVTCRVTSPFCPKPQISLWHHSGWVAKKAGALAFSFTWVFHRRAATAPIPVGALDQRDRAVEPPGDLERHAAAADKGVAAALELLDRGCDGGGHPLEQARGARGRRAEAPWWWPRPPVAGESPASS